jgi:Holliday junction resolvase RusA-like endonuclease
VLPVLTITAVGLPQPQGSKVSDKRGNMREAVTGLALWRQTLMAEAAAVRPAQPLDGPLALVVTFRLRRPASQTRAQRAVRWAWRKPDLDKLVRAVGDVLTLSKCVADDARVCDLRAIKLYAEPDELEGCTVAVGQL